MLLWWGPELIQFYNDAFVPSLGVGKHPGAIGMPGRESWAEVWPVVGAQLERVMSHGESVSFENALVPILRNGRMEEVYWTYGYSPVRDETGVVAGILIVCSETTARVLAERRLTVLRTFLSEVSRCEDWRSVSDVAHSALARVPEEVPFSATYLVDRATRSVARQRASLEDETKLSALDDLVRKNSSEQLTLLALPSLSGSSSSGWPGGPWPDPATHALIVPVAGSDLILVFGRSPRLPFDSAYREFLLHFVEGVTASVARIQALKSRNDVELERKNLLLQAPMPTAILSGPEHRFELANVHYERMVGRRVVGKTYLEAFPELRETPLVAVLDSVFRTGDPFVAPETLVPLARESDGVVEDRFFRFNLEAIRSLDGGIRGLMAVAFDVTDQVLARKALEEAVEKARRLGEEAARVDAVLRSLVDNLPDLAWSARPDGYIDFYNRRWYEYTGTTPEQMAGWGWKTVHDPQMVDAVARRWQACLESGDPFEMEFPLRGADGQFRWFLTRVRPLRDGSGQISRWFGVNTNIHERAAMVRQLETANFAKDEFLATVSHELRTPLTAILGWSRLLGSGAEPARIQKGLAVIERNARAQAQLIEDLLDVSRIISGKIRMTLKRVDVASVAQSAIETAQPSALARGIRLYVELGPELGEIIADEDRLQQVIWNLLSNAVKFTGKGGLVSLRVERANSQVEITVTDDGKGISPAFLPHVFDRFRQDDGSTTKQQAGLGLGLAIVRHLVELHGGTVSVESDGEGKGSTFHVDLPIRAVDPPASVPPVDVLGDRITLPGRPLSDRLRGLHILVVDDQDDARDLVSTVLEDAGATVLQASSVAAAMNALAEGEFSVIVSDIGMPGSDGYAFLRDLRDASKAHRMGTVPALALTAFARGEDRELALAAGFQEHVAKPIDPARLVEVVAVIAGR